MTLTVLGQMDKIRKVKLRTKAKVKNMKTDSGQMDEIKKGKRKNDTGTKIKIENMKTDSRQMEKIKKGKRNKLCTKIKVENMRPDSEQMEETKTEKRKKIEEKVVDAITALKKLNKKFFEDEAKKQPLLDQAAESAIFLQVTMKKIPPKRMMKRIEVLLPHSLVTDTTEVCLFTGDLEKNNRKAEIDPVILHYKELLKKEGVTNVTEVIPLRQLRTEYKVYEAKRQLMAAYDIFLSDKKIAQCLPRILGKSFFKKRKLPIQINMKTSNLKNQIEKALSKTVFFVSCLGSSCTSEVARLDMSDNEIVENIIAAVKVLAKKLPGLKDNIFGLYIKTAKSTAIPIYVSFGNPNQVKFLKPVNQEKVVPEELSTLPNANVKVYRDGRVVVKRSRTDSDDEEEVEDANNRNDDRHKKRRMEDEYAVQSEESEEVSDENEIHIKEEQDIEEKEAEVSKTKMKTKRGKVNTKNKVQVAKKTRKKEIK